MATYKRGSGNYKSSFINVIITKVDSTRTSTTTVADHAELVFTLRPLKRYYGYLYIRFKSNAVPDMKVTFKAITASERAIYIFGESVTPLSEIAFGIDTMITTDDNVQNQKINFFIETGATVSPLQFQWAQNTSSGDQSVIYESSTMVIFEE